MKIKWAAVLLVVMIVSATAFDSAAAQTRFGIRGGVYLDQDDPFLGAHFVHMIQRHWVFNPNFEYVLVDRGSFYTINADFHFAAPASRTMRNSSTHYSANFIFGACNQFKI